MASAMSSSVDEILAQFDRVADQFLSREDFIRKLRSGKKLRIKYCVDVTTPTVHIGHAVNLWLLRQMQDLGHKVIFLIGDFTTRIGDPHGRLETCQETPEKDILRNAKECITQARAVLRFDDPALIEVRHNSEWYGKMTAQELMKLFALITHARLIARDEFQMRIAQVKEIYIQEMLYPILRSYDTVMVESDLTVTGSDQFFNESLGRFLQEKYKKPPQTLITTQLTPGLDGHHKQSVGRDNHIGVTHSPRDKFGRVMSIPDQLIGRYFRIYTDVPLPEIEAMAGLIAERPREAKLKLAAAIVARYHGAEIARKELAWFEKTISQGEAPADLPTIFISNGRMEAFELVLRARHGKSKGDTRRLLRQGGVELNGARIKDPAEMLNLRSNDTLKVGKRSWFRIEIAKIPTLDTEHLWMKSLQVTQIDFISQYLPEWEMVKHLGKVSPGLKPDPAAVKSLFTKMLEAQDPLSEWAWLIAKKDAPEDIIGLALLQKGPQAANQTVWLAPDVADEAAVTLEAMTAVNAYAFKTLGFSTAEFRRAFSFATAPSSAAALQHSLRQMSSEQINHDTPDGSWGYTKEGWQMMQQWRRTISPWLFENSPLKNAAAENKPTPAPNAEAKPKAAPKKRSAFMMEPPRPKPRGMPEE